MFHPTWPDWLGDPCCGLPHWPEPPQWRSVDQELLKDPFGCLEQRSEVDVFCSLIQNHMPSNKAKNKNKVVGNAMPCHGKGKVSSTNQSWRQGEAPNSERSVEMGIEIGPSCYGSGRERWWVQGWMKSQVHCCRNRRIYSTFHTAQTQHNRTWIQKESIAEAEWRNELVWLPFSCVLLIEWLWFSDWVFRLGYHIHSHFLLQSIFLFLQS